MALAAERWLRARLQKVVDEREKPVNYKSLLLSPASLEYIDLGNTRHLVVFDEIIELAFVREEAIFPCINGPYLETKWVVCTSDGERIEIMDEALHRRMLVSVFALRLAGFDVDAANFGLTSSQEGRWQCFVQSNQKHVRIRNPA